MKLATKELVEKIVLRTASRSGFSVMSNDRSFLLNDDIVMQSFAENKQNNCTSVSVYQILNSIWEDTEEGKIYAVYAEGRRYVSQPDGNGNYPNYVSKSTPPQENIPKIMAIFNIDTGEICEYYRDTIGSRFLEKDPETTQRLLDILLKHALNLARNKKEFDYDKQFEQLCDKFCVDAKGPNFNVPQNVESRAVADYLLRFRNGGLVKKSPAPGSGEKDDYYVFAPGKYYIGVSANDDATPNEYDIKEALSYDNTYFEMYKRVAHSEYEGKTQPIYCEIYEGRCYNLIDGLFGKKAVPVPNKMPELFFAYNENGDYVRSSLELDHSIEGNKAEIEDLLTPAAEEAVETMLNDDGHSGVVKMGELLAILFNANEKRVPGCQWSEDFIKSEFAYGSATGMEK